MTMRSPPPSYILDFLINDKNTFIYYDIRQLFHTYLQYQWYILPYVVIQIPKRQEIRTQNVKILHPVVNNFILLGTVKP